MVKSKKIKVIIIVISSLFVYVCICSVGYFLMEQRDENITKLSIFEDAQEFLIEDSFFKNEHGTIIRIDTYQNNNVKIISDFLSEITCTVETTSHTRYSILLSYDYKKFSYINITALE